MHKEKLKSFFIAALSFVSIAILGFIDNAIGPYFSFQIFYLIPISMAAWFNGRWMSILPLTASAAIWFYNDVMISHAYSHPLIPYWNIFEGVIFFGFVIYILSKLKKVLDREKLFARIDNLTETANKRYFYESAFKELNRTNRYKRPVTLAYIDLDDFKHINDLFGHLTGDNVLHLAAQVFKNSVRGSDTVARFGGDEFAILFPETDYNSAEMVIRRIQNNFFNTMKDKRWPTTLSIGAVTCLTYPCTLESLITSADTLMYSAKKEGKNIVKHEILKDAASVQ